MSRSTQYGRLAQSLREAIERGDFAGGKRLPTEAELSKDNALSRQTVRRALQELVIEGLVYRVPGRGTFTTSASPGGRYLRSIGSIADLMALSDDTTQCAIRPFEMRADIDAASRLRLNSDQVMSALFVRQYDDAPFCVVEVFAPPAIGLKLVERGVLTQAGQTTNQTVLKLLDEIVLEGIAGAHQSITAVPVPPNRAELIGLDLAAPSLRIDRLYLDVRGDPIYLAINYYNPHRYAYRLELRRGGMVRQASQAAPTIPRQQGAGPYDRDTDDTDVSTLSRGP